VKVFGGRSEAIRNVDDPFLTSDRGLWFDGRYNFMTVENLYLAHTWSIELWANPMTHGTFFSSSRIYDHQSEVLSHIGLIGEKMEFEDKHNYFYAKTDVDVVAYNNSWANFIFSVYWD
jgi:hypothetical protein